MVRGHPRRGAERRSVTGNRWQRGRARAAGGGGRSGQPGPSCQTNEGEAAGSGRSEPKRKTSFVKYANRVRGPAG
jgi:hypothetical protein